MKKIIITLSLAVYAFYGLPPALGQVQIKSLPKPGYEQRIRDYVNTMKVVDTHEHLIAPEQLLKDRDPDFSLLLYHYSAEDLISAGLPSENQRRIWYSKILTISEKWQMIKPYWEGSFNTAYNRAVSLQADKLFGVKDMDSSTVVELSEKIKKAYDAPSEWFHHVLKDKCGIEYIINQFAWEGERFGDPKIFRYVFTPTWFIWINSKKDFEKGIKSLLGHRESSWGDKKINTFNDLVSSLETSFYEALDEGDIGVKITLAYLRTLSFENVSKEKAEKVFTMIKEMQDTIELSFNQVKPLQDYMMHRVLDLVKKNHIPVQIHTGLQSGNGNIIENSKPTHLVNLFQEYPSVKFILFHGAYPYGGELSTLAKNFPNVYIDMCWDYIISPSYSERYLNEWLETVPANKIMGFGGDFQYVEGTYAHLLLAKQVISNVLVAKVRNGYFTEDEAIKIVQMILHDNAVRIFNLK